MSRTHSSERSSRGRPDSGLAEDPSIFENVHGPTAKAFRAVVRLRDDLRSVASAETAYDPRAYAKRGGECALFGHCAAVAYVVQKELGGSILSARIGGETHFWNKLSDGIEVDLTGDQYGGDGITPVVDSKTARVRNVPPRRTVNPRFQLLAQRLADRRAS